MYLVTGGLAQGKLSFILDKFGYSINEVFDGGKADIKMIKDKPIINHFEKIVEFLYDEGIETPAGFINRNIENFENKIIITREVGNGIVPIDKRQRELRELIGRTNCILAREADEVYRVICGIGQRIK